MGTSSARRGAGRQHAVGPHVAAGLTDRTGIVAASVPENPAAETEVPAAWRGWRASSAVLWAGAVMLLVLTLSSGFNEQPPPAKVASAQPPRPGSVRTLQPPAPAPAPVPRSSSSVGPVESHAATRDRAEESVPAAADPTPPPAAPAPDTGALAQTAERSSGADGSLAEQALPAAEPSAVESRVEDQVADRVETVVEPVRRAVDTAFGMLLEITEQ